MDAGGGSTRAAAVRSLRPRARTGCVLALDRRVRVGDAEGEHHTSPEWRRYRRSLPHVHHRPPATLHRQTQAMRRFLCAPLLLRVGCSCPLILRTCQSCLPFLTRQSLSPIGVALLVVVSILALVGSRPRPLFHFRSRCPSVGDAVHLWVRHFR